MTCNVGDIVHLKMNGNYKTNILSALVKQKHPLLVVEVFNRTSQVRIATMSSNINQVKNITPHNVLLNDWKAAGLHKPTYVDVSSTGIIDDSNVFRILGNLTRKDWLRISLQLSKTSQRQIVEAYKIYNTGYPEYLDYFIDLEGNINYVEV